MRLMKWKKFVSSLGALVLVACITLPARATDNFQFNLGAGAIDDEIDKALEGNTDITDTAGNSDTSDHSDTSVTMSGSSDTKLQSLSFEPASISPAFSPEQTKYTITLRDKVTEVKVDAVPNDPNTKIIAKSGFNNLKNGNNNAVFTVKAGNGTTQTYEFTIVKKGNSKQKSAKVKENDIVEPVDGYIPIVDSERSVSVEFPDVHIPEGCVKVKYIYKGQIVEAAYFEEGSLMLLYLSKPDGTEGGVCLYYSGSDEFMEFVKLKGMNEQFIFPIQYPIGVPIPAGFVDTTVEVDGYEVPAFSLSVDFRETKDYVEETGEMVTTGLKNAEDYYLFYAIHSNGTEGWYLYDSDEGTYQRYLQLYGLEEEVDPVYVKYKKQSQKRMLFIAILGVLLAASIILLINSRLTIKDLLVDEDDDEDDDGEDGMKESDTVQREASAKEKKVAERKAMKKNKPNEAVESNETQEEVVKSDKKSEKTVDTADVRITNEQKRPIMYDIIPDRNKTEDKKDLGGLDDDFEFEFIKLDD